MSSIARSRMDEELKRQAESILNDVGIKPSDAIRMLYKQIVNRGTFPLELKVANKITQAAIEEARTNADTLDVYDSFEDLLDETD